MRYLGTLNNPQEKYPDFISQDWLSALHNKVEAVYTNGQLEKGADGTVHLQFYIALPSKGKRITQLKKVCPHTHWEPVGKDNGASSYAMKEDTRLEGPWEFGEKPANVNTKEGNAKHKEKNARLLQGDLKEMVNEGLIPISQLPLIKKGLDIYAKLDQKPAVTLQDTCGIWLYGPPGTGKSHRARNDMGFTEDQVHIKNINKWFDDYDQERHKAFLLDDLDHSHAALGHYLKIWADKYPF